MLNLEVLQEHDLVHKEQVANLLTQLSAKLYMEAMLSLQNHYEWIVHLAEKLLEVETMTGEEFSLLMQQLEEIKL